MILPIVAYGHPTLRKKAENIDADFPALSELIANMFETMYATNGVGLAAPQIGKSIRLFVIDARPYAEEYGLDAATKMVFINPEIIDFSGEEWIFNEGCLSVPDIREDVSRKTTIRIKYADENFNYTEKVFEGILSRIIQHEYDHLEGVLFPDRLPSLRKILLKRKLSDIARGAIDPPYRMTFGYLKKRR
jgi:peptide deformylase